MFKATMGFVAGAVLAVVFFLIVGEVISVMSAHPDPGHASVVMPSPERP